MAQLYYLKLMSKKKKSKRSFKYLHHVDVEHERVYVHGGSLFGAIAASHSAKKFWPDYDIILASQQLIEDLNGEQL